jgi:hypothetical protein
MMDYYSDFPAPNKESSINEVLRYIKSTKKYTSIIDNKQIPLKDIVTTHFNQVTNNNTIRGSATGWAVYERVEIIKMTMTELEKYNINVKRRLRGIIKALVLINKTYFDHLKIYYAPGGPGMTEAYADFIEKGNTLIIA